MNILLLEDNRFDADLIIRSLEKKIDNVSIHNAQSISEARELIKNKTDYDIALLDLNLPDGNGLEILVELRRRKIEVLTIVLTSVRDEEQAVIALKTGADDYFIKEIENYIKLPDILLHNLNTYKKDYDSVKVLDILYLEHDSSLATSATKFFNNYAPHIKICICNSKEEVLEKIQYSSSQKCKYQALIIDYIEITLESLDFLKKIRQELNINLPIIILTNHGNEQTAIQALKLGAYEYIVKKDNYLLRLPSIIENANKYHLLLKHKKYLENSEKRYRLLAENAGDVIFTLDLNFNYTYVSPSVKNLQKYEPEDLIDQNIKKNLTNESFSRLRNTFEKLLYIYENIATYTPTVVELEMYKKDATKIWTEVKISILINEKNKAYGILGVTRDISLRKTYEKQLIKAKEKAEENDRLKSAFLANISHEIRTPMNGILGFAELLKTKNLNSDKINLYVQTIEISGKRMLNTLNDLMDISKIEAGLIDINFSEFDLNKLLEYQYFFFNEEAENKNIKLNYQINNKKEPFIIHTDKTKLNAVLGNLIKNAIKYTDNGTIDFGYQAKKNILEFFIKDSGIGIAKEAQEKIFVRFVQANQDYTIQREGTGLGLAISKSYIDALGGKIWVESELNQGATFSFTIPYIIKSKKRSESVIKKNQPDLEKDIPKYKNKSVLIVEDDAISMELLHEILKDHFGKIKSVNNGYSAIDLCAKEHFDIIFMDIKMPGINGFETAKKIKAENKDLFIIAQSAFVSKSDQRKAILNGCDAYFTKPIIKRELLEFIESKLAMPIHH